MSETIDQRSAKDAAKADSVVTKAPTPNAVTKAQADADAARAKADEAQAAAARQAAAAFQEAQDRADAAAAARQQWQTIHAGPMDSTERLVLKGGYLLRSTWRAIKGRQGADPLDGNSMVFVPGDAPVMSNPQVMILTVADLNPDADPENARLEDAHPLSQIPTTPEVLLLLPDGQVRVLKSRDPSAVGTVRAVTPADGVV